MPFFTESFASAIRATKLKAKWFNRFKRLPNALVVNSQQRQQKLPHAIKLVN